jgi:membrane protease YdiL (CAAX protease family)
VHLRPAPRFFVTGQLFLHLLVFFLYSLGVSIAAFLLPPPLRLPGALLVFGLVLKWYLLPHAATVPDQRLNPLQLNPLRGATLRWVLAAAPAMLFLSWSLGELYVRIVPVPSHVLNPFGEMVMDPLQSLVIAVLAIAVAPVVEEFFFRGLIQHRIEQVWGIAPALVVTSLLFAVVHVDTLPWVIPLHAVLGAIFGWAVYVTRSIWAGVILHAVNNCAAVIGLGMEPPERQATVWEAGIDTGWWLALAMLAAALAVGAWVAHRLRREAAR